MIQTGAPGRATVSLTMIVKDEEASLAACLDSARGLFDETVVVDTGSADRTVKVARSAPGFSTVLQAPASPRHMAHTRSPTG